MTKLNSGNLLFTGIGWSWGTNTHSTVTFVAFTSRNKTSLKNYEIRGLMEKLVLKICINIICYINTIIQGYVKNNF